MPDTQSIRVFVNGAGLDVPSGASALEAVRQWDAAEGDAVAGGTRLITDSRGLPVEPAVTVYNGAIFRLVTNRQRGAGASE